MIKVIRSKELTTQLHSLNKTSGEISAIYHLFHNNSIVYIGKTKNAKQRIKTHISDSVKVFDDFRIVPCPSHLLRETELTHIKIHNPVFNTDGAQSKAVDMREYCDINNILYEEVIKEESVSLFKSYEIAVFFGIPKPTAANWSKAKDWRGKHYKTLEKIYAEHLAKIAKDM